MRNAGMKIRQRLMQWMISWLIYVLAIKLSVQSAYFDTVVSDKARKDWLLEC